MHRNRKNLLELRKNIAKKRPSFRRVESWRYVRVKDSWRKPRGIDSKTRKKKKSGVKIPNVGYRGPKSVRGIHPTGYIEVRVETMKDLEMLNPRNHALKISSKLGSMKRLALIDYAQNKNFYILNLGISAKEMEEFESMLESPIDELEEDEYMDEEDLEDDIGMDEYDD